MAVIQYNNFRECDLSIMVRGNSKKQPQFYLKPNLAATNDNQYLGEKALELVDLGH